MNIILLGYRGCGKTSIGRKLASQLWKTFADVDHEILRRFDNKTVAQVWEEFGEPAYRKVEVDVTRELVAKKDHVIALGGGTLMTPDARQAVVDAADTVRIYLKCATRELFRRISEDKVNVGSRPALTKHGGGLEEIEAVLAVRAPVYEAVADKVFDVTHLNVDDALRYLIDRCL